MTVKENEHEIGVLKEQVKVLLGTVKTLQDKITRLENELNKEQPQSLASCVSESPKWSDILKKGIEQKKALDGIVRICKDKVERAKSVIIFGVPEAKEKVDLIDDKFIDDMVEKIGFLGVDTVDHQRFRADAERLKSVDTNPRPIRLKLPSEYDKFNLLKAARNLKGIEKYKNISIRMDLNPEEREVERNLIKERNRLNSELTVDSGFRYGIRRGEIVQLTLNAIN